MFVRSGRWSAKPKETKCYLPIVPQAVLTNLYRSVEELPLLAAEVEVEVVGGAGWKAEWREENS